MQLQVILAERHGFFFFYTLVTLGTGSLSGKTLVPMALIILLRVDDPADHRITTITILPPKCLQVTQESNFLIRDTTTTMEYIQFVINDDT